MSHYVRARSQQQKHERLNAIMKASDKLFLKKPYHKISMGAIAQSLGWSRSNLYKYASTHEEILLMVHDAKFKAWTEQLIADLEDIEPVSNEFSASWAAITEKHADLMPYLSICAQILETNSSPKALIRSKESRAQAEAELIEFLAKKCYIQKERAELLCSQLICMAPALYERHHPTSAAKKALKGAKIDAPAKSFANNYAEYVSLCIDDAYRGPVV